MPAGRLTLTAERVPLTDVDAVFLGSQQLAGQLDGTATLTGSLDAPAGSADLHMATGRAGGVAFQDLRVQTAFKDKVADIDVHLLVDSVSQMTIRGRVPFEGSGLDLHAEATSIQAALLTPLTRTHATELGGTLKFSIDATGALKTPSIRGDVTLSAVQFRFAPTGALFKNTNGTIHFDGDRVTVQNFVIEDDDGHAMTVSGSSAGGGLGRSLDIAARSTGLHLLRNELGEVALGVDLRATGNVLSPRIEGTLRVERGRLEVDRILSRFTRSAYTPATPEPATPETPAEPGMFSQASMDIQIHVPENLVLRGRDLRPATGSIGLGDLNVTAGGDLRITKAPAQPTLVVGAVQIVRGSYSFQGRRFEIERGSEIRLRGEQMLDPELAITATRDIAGVTARVALSGTVRRPEITLSSDPPLDQGDILALIVFNQPVNELGNAEQANLAERAGLMAAGAVATPLADSVAKALDLDVFEIRQAEAEGGGPTITVGRQVSERLFVGFRHEFGRDETSRVSFEYRIRSFLRLVTTIGQSSQNPNRIPHEEAYGLDLFFVIKR
jgi:translocation and assembly module TamB